MYLCGKGPQGPCALFLAVSSALPCGRCFLPGDRVGSFPKSRLRPCRRLIQCQEVTAALRASSQSYVAGERRGGEEVSLGCRQKTGRWWHWGGKSCLRLRSTWEQCSFRNSALPVVAGSSELTGSCPSSREGEGGKPAGGHPELPMCLGTGGAATTPRPLRYSAPCPRAWQTESRALLSLLHAHPPGIAICSDSPQVRGETSAMTCWWLPTPSPTPCHPW